MSRVGLDWYKRQPVAYLGDVQGLTSKEHAVYSIVIDLIYQHGGTINNDPKWIAGWIKDMGSSAVRKALASLDANTNITITITDGEITQNRAKTEAKLKQNQSETAAKHGKKGGEKTAELRRQANEINTLDLADAENESLAEKRREEKRSKKDTKVSTKKPIQNTHSIPDKWHPTQEGIAYAIENGFPERQVQDEISGFIIYWTDRKDKRSERGWISTWQRYCRTYGPQAKRNSQMANGKKAFRNGQNPSLAAIVAERRSSDMGGKPDRSQRDGTGRGDYIDGEFYDASNK